MSFIRKSILTGATVILSVMGLFADGPYQKALNLLNDRDSVDAMLAFQECTNYKNCSDSAYLYLANLHLSLNQDSAAYFSCLGIFIEKGYGHFDHQFQVGAHLARNRKPGADKWLKQLLKDPQYGLQSAALLADYYRQTYSFDSAFKYRLVQERMGPRNTVLGRSNLVRAIELRNPALMKSLGNKIYGQNNSDPIANLALAQVAFQKNDIKTAMSHAMQCGRKHINQYDLYRPRLYALYYHQRWDLLVREVRAFKNEVINFDQDAYLLAHALVQTGRSASSLPYLNKIYRGGIFAFPDSFMVASIFFNHSQYTAAKKIFLNLQHHNRSEIYEKLGDIYTAQDSVFKAVDYYRQSAFITGDSKDHRKYASAAVGAGLYGKALPSLELLQERHPEDLNVLKQLHQVYKIQNNITKLMELIPQRLKLEPGNDALSYELAKLYTRNRQWANAEYVLAGLYYNNKDQKEVGKLYAMVLHKQKKFHQALSLLEGLSAESPADKDILQEILAIPDSVLKEGSRIVYTQKLLDVEPLNIYLRKSLISMLGREEPKRPGYINELVALYEQTPSDTRVLKLIVTQMLQNGKRLEVIPYLENLVKLDNDFDQLVTLSSLYEQSGDRIKCLAILERAYLEAPEDEIALKIYDYKKGLGGDQQALDFLTRHAARGSYCGSVVYSTLSRSMEGISSRNALAYAEKAFSSQRNAQTAFHLSRLRLLLGIGGSVASSSYPCDHFSYQGDTLWYLEGLKAYTGENFEIAVRNFNKIGERSLLDECYNPLILSLHHKRDWQAILVRSQNVRTEELKPETFFAVCEASLKLGQYPDLKKRSSTYMNTYPGDTVAGTFLALAYFNLNQYDKALPLLEKGLGIKKYHRAWVWAHGYSNFMLKQYADAERIWAGESASFSDWDTAYYYRSEGLLALNDSLSALNVLRSGLSLHPESRLLLSQSASLTEALNDEVSSFNYSSKLESLEPGNSRNKIRLARYYIQKQQPQKALDLMASPLAGQSYEALLVLASAQLSVSKYQEAIQTCTKAIKLKKKTPQAYLYLSKAYEQTGDFEQSQMFFRKYTRVAGR